MYLILYSGFSYYFVFYFTDIVDSFSHFWSNSHNYESFWFIVKWDNLMIITLLLLNRWNEPTFFLRPFFSDTVDKKNATKQSHKPLASCTILLLYRDSSDIKIGRYFHHFSFICAFMGESKSKNREKN